MKRVLAIAAAALGFAAPLAQAAGDAGRGASAFRACAACHTLEPGRNVTGPSLAGVWGRKAGTLAGYRRYSKALASAPIVWDARTLDAWLRDPAAMVPGNHMSFPGVLDDGVRADLVAFLRLASSGEAPRAPSLPPLPDLKRAPPGATVAAIRHCGDSYFVTSAAGETIPYWEFNLRFKTDSSAHGPAPDAPVVVGQGMQGDRAQVVFARPQDIARFIREGC